VINVPWRRFSESIYSIGVGGRLGNFQNGFPSLVLASRGYV